MPVRVLAVGAPAGDGRGVRALTAVAAACCALLAVAPVQASPRQDMRVLQYVEAEEVLIRDLMAAFASVYESRTLDRIVEQDRQHAHTLERILGKGSLQRASEDGSSGVISGYAGLMEQYWKWMSLGYRDLHAAAEAGIAAEKQHLAVLEATIAALADPDIRRQLKQIRRQDQQHLEALERLRARTPSVQPCVDPRC
ncbi:MAG: hypothetical protein B7C55_12845 [Actinomycetales bacterium mxb001]|nr:MAG: hypothetical protein B7C55_12845 [Actinomycetales bacterium mxb001]